ncbi:MAG TPA: hypothetical protein PK490_07275 [Prosthecobacter sp.]|nr:hypothetical protein [Prosthecobacter sp.]
MAHTLRAARRSGDAQFQSFVTRIAKNALPDGNLVVQLVAPVWTAQQTNDIVWPSDKSGAPEISSSPPIPSSLCVPRWKSLQARYAL